MGALSGAKAGVLKVLLVEDSDHDAELLLLELKRAAIECESRRVQTAADLARELETFRPDVVLADFAMPGFGGLEALKIHRDLGLDIPFIFVSGSIGEDVAVEAMKAGADDYVMKANLAKLAPALRRELREAATRHARKAAEAGLRRAQLMAKLAHVITAPDGAFESWSDTLPDLAGVAADALPKSTRAWLEILHPDDRARFRSMALEAGVKHERGELEYRLRRPDGALVHVRQTMEPLGEADPQGRLRWFNTLQDVTQLRREERFKGAIVESSLDCLIAIDHEGKIVEFNPAAQATFGFTREQALGKPMVELIVPPRLRDAHRRGFARYLASGESRILGRRLELEAIRADGREFPIELAIAAIGETSKPMFTAFIRDITARKEAEDRIKRMNRVQAVLSGINAAIVRLRDRQELFDASCRIAVEAGQFPLAWIGVVDRRDQRVKAAAWAGDERGFVQLLRPTVDAIRADKVGLSAQAIASRGPAICNDIEADGSAMRYAKEALERGYRSAAALPLTVDGVAIGALVLYAGEPGFFDEDEIKLLVELAGDISFAMAHIEKSEQLDYLAYYDSLTGLANRTLFQERLAQFVHAAAREQHRLALLVLDIERFKSINDSLGRQAGDALLKRFAERIGKSGDDPTRVARLGADHFALVLPRVRGDDQLALRVEARMHDFCDESFKLGETELRISAKAGVALFPDDAANAEALFKNAEAALKKAKSTGERYVFYAQEMTERIAEKLSLENKLRQALETEEFVLHYQPKVDLVKRQIVGVEALIRWMSAQRGLVPPAHFIPLLEETGLIQEVGAWALRRAAADHRRWVELKLKAPRVAVNVSQIQLRHRDFVGAVEQAIIEGIAPTGIDLEITESMVMQDVQANIEKLNALRKLGVRIAIDDFGTGYSSLGYLAQLPVESLKIDRSFIVKMEQDPNAMTLVSTIISLAHSLRLKVVAEGVETEGQAKLLGLLRCDEMQGYLISKPLPEAELVKLLRG